MGWFGSPATAVMVAVVRAVRPPDFDVTRVAATIRPALIARCAALTRLRPALTRLLPALTRLRPALTRLLIRAAIWIPAGGVRVRTLMVLVSL